jgi:EAL domain-containing protein (putative c-di-GMP-specific phosphodiesterase class I)
MERRAVGNQVLDPELGADLIGAAERGEIVPAFQPQFDVLDHAVRAVELLARWQHPHRGPIPPLSFIPLAEETGAIDEIGLFMLERAGRYSREWDRAGYGVTVSVNVSALQLEDPAFTASVRRTVEQVDFDPERVTLELTESQPLHDVTAAARNLQELRDLGFGASIDDYGLGHSDITRLLELPVSELKLDRAVVLEAEHHGPQVVAKVVALAKERGLSVVAEGIETESQLQLAEALECDRVQGYLLSKPVSEPEMLALLDAGH